MVAFWLLSALILQKIRHLCTHKNVLLFFVHSTSEKAWDIDLCLLYIYVNGNDI